MNPQKILMIRTGALGDVLLTTPVLAEIRKKFPDAQIIFLIKSQFIEAIKHNSAINTIVTIEKGQSLLQLKRQLNAQGPFDVVVDLQASAKTKLLCLMLAGRKQVYRFTKPYFKRLMLVFFKKNLFERPISVTERYFDAVAGLGIVQPAVKRLVLARQKPQKQILQQLPKKYFVIAPGAKWFTKRWPAHYWPRLIQLLAKKYKYEFIICGGKDEAGLATEIINTSETAVRKKIVNLAGQLALAETAWVVANSQGVVSNDSGLMHVASAADVPLLGLFLSTVKEFGFAPVTPYGEVCVAENISCRPCNHKGLAACPQKHFACGLQLSPEMVESAFTALLKKFQKNFTP